MQFHCNYFIEAKEDAMYNLATTFCQKWTLNYHLEGFSCICSYITFACY